MSLQLLKDMHRNKQYELMSYIQDPINKVKLLKASQKEKKYLQKGKI